MKHAGLLGALCAVLAVTLVACSSTPELDHRRVKVGMTMAELQALPGSPTARYGDGTEPNPHLTYLSSESPGVIDVFFMNGKVARVEMYDVGKEDERVVRDAEHPDAGI